LYTTYKKYNAVKKIYNSYTKKYILGMNYVLNKVQVDINQ